MILGTLFSNPMVFVAWLVAILVGLTIHEFAHAFAAYRQGDPTPKLMGRISFNPLKHIDVFGFISLVLVGFGWGKPVPVNPVYFKNKKWGDAIVAFAGPFVNLILAIVFGIILKIVWMSGNFGIDNLMVIFLYNLIMINIILCLFNLIPLPPLDGSHILFAVLPPKFDELKYQIAKNGSNILFSIIIVDMIFNIGIFSWMFGFFLDFAGKLIFS